MTIGWLVVWLGNLFSSLKLVCCVGRVEKQIEISKLGVLPTYIRKARSNVWSKGISSERNVAFLSDECTREHAFRISTVHQPFRFPLVGWFNK